MKNLFFLTAIFATILFSSCEKKNPTPEVDPNAVTAEMLVGYDWIFASIELDGEVYTECNLLLKNNYDLTVFDLVNVREDVLTFNNNCSEHGQLTGELYYEIHENTLIFNDGNDIYDILSTPDEVKNGKLRIKHYKSFAVTAPIGSTITLTN